MATMTQNSTQTTPSWQVSLASLPARYRLILGSLMVAVLALLASFTAVSAYSNAYSLFEDIAVFYSTKVDAAERALQDLSRTSQATADYTALTSDTPLYEQAVNDIFRNFNSYRAEMFILQSNLQTPEEHTAFTVADTFTYSRFWRHVSNLIDASSDINLARREYLAADNHLRNRINPALEKLEALNFNLMVDAGNRAGAEITTRVLLVALVAFGLAALVTVISFWMRRKVKRYITPGLDAALVLAWAIPILMVLNLLSLPGEINKMTQQAYYSISGASRVLVAGNLANRAESSAIIDASRADFWFEQFDSNAALLELRMCGVAGCMTQVFVNTSGNPDTAVVNAARAVTPDDDLDVALIGSVDFAGEGEARTLETARVAFQEYITIHNNLRALVKADDLTAAVELNTGFDAGDSEEAYGRFVEAIEEVQSINREVFDNIWTTRQSELPRNQILLGVIGYVLLVIFMAAGVNHRYREL